MTLDIVERRAMVKVFRRKYRYAEKLQKSQIIEEFIEFTGFNRNYASQVLRGHYDYKKSEKKKRKRIAYYDSEVVLHLEKIWKILDYICGKRMVKILPEIIRKLEQFNEIDLTTPVKEKLCKISASSIDRLLRPAKRRLGRKGTSTTKQPRYLIDRIPIKTFTEWQDSQPGFAQLDLVSHNGGNVFGGFFHTLNTTDVCTGWTNLNLVKDKTKLRMLKSLICIKNSLPFPLLGIHSDNGAEFINETVLAFTEKYGIEFTRGRPYKKNDNPHVEQKNYSVIRRNTGYLRYDKPEHASTLKEMYTYINLYVNYFHPIMILKEKHRQGAKSIRKYDEPKTPYQRILERKEIISDVKNGMRIIYEELNPAELRRKINECQSVLIQSAAPYKKRKPENIRRKKELPHTVSPGRRDGLIKQNPNPFLEKQKIEEMRRAIKTLDNGRNQKR